ncbi:hypothetical protein F0L74_21290 [Chitinophaga agrisoli]|uniref:Uncharacterized protein n=1 Tax=Chitinophaga agrisoli TaxID=2607653 RepID=A0A5B2VGQ4_9BACT|nr:hypothetical protein [Chitinophaga agrisoli]KAA2238753.1 hypothetical protein F0L74_21290 [Chitinophaga agrisoli]
MKRKLKKVVVRHYGNSIMKIEEPAVDYHARRADNFFLRQLKNSDLSEIEDHNFDIFFSIIGERAATNAINENRALGLPITYLKDDWVVREMPDGSFEYIEHIPQKPQQQFKKGQVLHVKKTH